MHQRTGLDSMNPPRRHHGRGGGWLLLNGANQFDAMEIPACQIVYQKIDHDDPVSRAGYESGASDQNGDYGSWALVGVVHLHESVFYQPFHSAIRQPNAESEDQYAYYPVTKGAIQDPRVRSIGVKYAGNSDQVIT